MPTYRSAIYFMGFEAHGIFDNGKELEWLESLDGIAPGETERVRNGLDSRDSRRGVCIRKRTALSFSRETKAWLQ